MCVNSLVSGTGDLADRSRFILAITSLLRGARRFARRPTLTEKARGGFSF